jgi:hypothetical protein
MPAPAAAALASFQMISFGEDNLAIFDVKVSWIHERRFLVYIDWSGFHLDLNWNTHFRHFDAVVDTNRRCLNTQI